VLSAAGVGVAVARGNGFAVATDGGSFGKERWSRNFCAWLRSRYIV